MLNITVPIAPEARAKRIEVKAAHGVGDGPHKVRRFARVVGGWLQETLCGVRGHDSVLHFESRRVSLQCTSCGHETPGWTIKP
jgi:hypothetical protein